MPSAAELRAAFAAFDSDGNGVLTYDEISGIFTRPGGGKPMTEEEAMAWVEKYDKSGDGTLDLDEFAAALAAGRVAGAAGAATAVGAVERLPSRKRGRGFRLRCVDAMQRAVFPERGARSAGRRRPRASNAR